ncbi:MAG: tol-pal system YbgF family protein, partial [Gammaproteobacteria bacterium]
ANFGLGHYADAERGYARLLAMPGGDELSRAEFAERVAAAVYRQGEQAQAAGDFDLAVSEYLRVAAVQPGSAFAPNAVFDAGTLLIAGERWSEAVDVLQRFRSEYPAHEFNDDVTQKLAFAYQSGGQPARAAAEYERISLGAGAAPELQREALWQAAELYAANGSQEDQRRVYAEIVARFPEPFAEALEARQKVADLAMAAGDRTARVKWLDAIVAVDASAGASRSDRSRTLAARATLELAGPPRDAFLSVALTIPLKKSLKLKKQRMEAALAAYGRAADYGIAAVTTAATYEIAHLYYRLSQDLMHSERPPELSAEELEQYQILLEEQAFPFEEQAIEVFESNAVRARDGVYDEWVRMSFARLAELMPARYAKSERSENLVAALD